jgi:hypothetical protein
MNLNLLAIAFHSVLGNVESSDISHSLELMGKGMLGIFIVMVLIYLVTVLLDKVTGKNK